MDSQSLRNVLSILRRLAQTNQSTTASQFISSLTGSTSVSPSTALRIASYILDQIELARAVIQNSQLVDEAKSGVNSALSALEKVFSLGSLSGSLGSITQAAPGYISNFVILLSAAGINESSSAPAEATDLAAEIDTVSKQFDDKEIDPVVTVIAKKHLYALSALLRQIPVFGLEPALTAYFELVATLRRADSGASTTSKGKLDTVMGVVRSWGERLSNIDKIVNAGANLLERADHASALLEYIPDL